MTSKLYTYCFIIRACLGRQFYGQACPTGQSRREKIVAVWENVYLRSQILERPSIGNNWNISCIPVLTENVMFTFYNVLRFIPQIWNAKTV